MPTPRFECALEIAGPVRGSWYGEMIKIETWFFETSNPQTSQMFIRILKALLQSIEHEVQQRPRMGVFMSGGKERVL